MRFSPDFLKVDIIRMLWGEYVRYTFFIHLFIFLGMYIRSVLSSKHMMRISELPMLNTNATSMISSIIIKNTPPCFQIVINKGGILNNFQISKIAENLIFGRFRTSKNFACGGPKTQFSYDFQKSIIYFRSSIFFMELIFLITIWIQNCLLFRMT